MCIIGYNESIILKSSYTLFIKSAQHKSVIILWEEDDASKTLSAR